MLTEYDDSEVDTVLEVTEKMHAHLTAAIVSNDLLFVQKMLANTVNGTTYAGIRARCTGESFQQLAAVLSPSSDLLACDEHAVVMSSIA